MKHPDWTQADSREAKQIWKEYQKRHNLSDRIGQTVQWVLIQKVSAFGLVLRLERLSSKEILKDCILLYSFNESALKPISVKELVGDSRNSFR